MIDSGQIGQKARELDEKSISERIKLKRRSLKKIIGAIFVYIAFMSLFYLLL